MNSQYARTTSPQLPDNSPSILAFSSIRHLHFFTCHYDRPRWQTQGRRKTDRERENFVLFARHHTGKMVKFSLRNVEKRKMDERARRRLLSRWAKKSIFFAYCCKI